MGNKITTMKSNLLVRLLTCALLTFIVSGTIYGQANSSTFATCTSGGCVTSSTLELIGVEPGANPGDPATIIGGETFEMCYTVTGWNFININWFHGAEPVVGPGLIDPSATSNITTSQGVNQNWIWNSYCTINCCDSSGDNTTTTPNNVCGPPATGAWLFAVDSGQTICQGGSANDGETSNNWGDSGSSGFQFCLEVETDCTTVPGDPDIISSDVAWNVYSDSDMGTWGYGQASNNCGCEGGSEECSLDLDVICCDIPEVNGCGMDDSEILVNGGCNVECTDEVVSFSIEGDVGNPDYEYEWSGPEGSGPNSPVWDASSSPPLPLPPSDGIYTLLVTNSASGDCPIQFETELFAGGVASGGDATVCAGFGDIVEIPVNAAQIGGLACNLPGVACLTSSDPNNPNEEATVFIDPNEMGPGQVGTHTYSVFIGQTGTSCFSLDSYTIEVLPQPVQPLMINPSEVQLCTNMDIADGLPSAFNILNPTTGFTYDWSFSATYSPDAVFVSGSTSADISGDFNPDLTGVTVDNVSDLIQTIFVYPINTTTGCVGLPSSVDITFQVCSCVDIFEFVDADLQLCGSNVNDMSDFLDIDGLEDLSGAPFDPSQGSPTSLDWDFGIWADPQPNRVEFLQYEVSILGQGGSDTYYQSNTPQQVIDQQGASDGNLSDLEAMLTDLSINEPCIPLEVSIDINLICSIVTTSPDIDGDGIDEIFYTSELVGAGSVNFLIYPNVQEAVDNGLYPVTFDDTCTEGPMCLPILPCNSGPYSYTFSQGGTNPSCSNLSTGTLTVTITNDEFSDCGPVDLDIPITCSVECSVPDNDPLMDEILCSAGSVMLPPWEDFFTDDASITDISGVTYFLDPGDGTIPPNMPIDGTTNHTLAAGDECTATEIPVWAFLTCTADVDMDGNDDLIAAGSFVIVIFPDPSDWLITDPVDGTCCPSLTGDCLDEAWFDVDNDYDTNGAMPDCSAEDMTGTITWDVENTFSFTSPTSGAVFTPPAACATMQYSADFDCEQCAFAPTSNFPGDNNYCEDDMFTLAIDGLDALDTDGDGIVDEGVTIEWDIQGNSPAENAAFDDMISIDLIALVADGNCNVDLNAEYTVTCLEDTSEDFGGPQEYQYFVFVDPQEVVMLDAAASNDCEVVLENVCPPGQLTISYTTDQGDSGNDDSFTANPGEAGDVTFTIEHVSADAPAACNTFTIVEAYDCAGCPTLNGTPVGDDYCDGEMVTFDFDVTTGGLTADIELTFPDGSVQTETTDASGEASFDYTVTSPDGCNDPNQMVAYVVTCENGDAIDDGMFPINVFVEASGVVDANECGASISLDCSDFTVSITDSSDPSAEGPDGDTFAVDGGDTWNVEFTVVNPGAPDACNANFVDTANDVCTATCPTNIDDTPDQDVCDGQDIDLMVTYDNDGIVEWDLPTNPTTTSGEVIMFTTNSSDGCGESQTVNYVIRCDEDMMIESSGSITFQIFAQASGMASDGGCEASVTGDCPEFVVTGGNMGSDDTFTAASGMSGTNTFTVSNPGAPSGCDMSVDVDADFDCAANCPQNIDDTPEQDLCDGETLSLFVSFDNAGTVEWTLPDGSTETGEMVDYTFTSDGGCNETQTVTYEITCTDTPMNVTSGSITFEIFVQPSATIAESDCSVVATGDCTEFVITGGNDGDDTFTAMPGESGTADFVITNPGAPAGCDEAMDSGDFDCPSDFVCPTFDMVTTDREICDGEELTFEVEITGNADDASVTWSDGPGGATLGQDFTLTQTFNSPDGCNDTQQISWELLCSDGTVIDGGNIIIDIFTVPTATITEDECEASIILDCPNDGIVVTYDDGGAISGNGTSYPGMVNSMETVVFTLTPNPDAPAPPCDDAVDIPVDWTCDGDCPFASFSDTQALCDGGDVILPTETDINITDDNGTAVDGTFVWLLGPNSDPDTDSADSGTGLAAIDSCNETMYIFEAYIQCDNNGVLSWVQVGTLIASVFPQVDYDITIDSSGDCDVYNVSPSPDMCSSFLIEIDGISTNVYEVQPGAAQTVDIVVFDNSFPAGCDTAGETITVSCDGCPVCDGSPGVCEFDDNFEYCGSDPAGGDDLPVMDVNFFIPSTGVDAEIGFYLDDNGDDEYVPGTLTATDNCTASVTEIFILIECQGGTTSTGASFMITVHPEPADMDVTINDNGTCCPTITWECDGVAGWTVENDFDGNGATPDCSSTVDAGSIAFTFENTNFADCTPNTQTATYNCSNCGSGTNDSEQFICETGDLDLADYADLTIDDPSGTLLPATFAWYDEGDDPNDGAGVSPLGGTTVSHGNPDDCAPDAARTLTGYVECSDGNIFIPVATLTYTVFPEVQEPQITFVVDPTSSECDYTITAVCPNDVLSPDAFGPQPPGTPASMLTIDVGSGDADSPCMESFVIDVPLCPSVGCPISSGANTDEILCNGSNINFPQEGTDFDIDDSFGSLIAGSFAWYTSPSTSGAAFTGNTATHPGGCDPIDLDFFAFVMCDAPDGSIQDIPVATHTVTVYPDFQMPDIIRDNSLCDYRVEPACPNDVLDPDSFGPLDQDSDGGSISINVSDPANPCVGRDFDVVFDPCPGIPPGVNIPTAFSPNGDGFNDIFSIFGDELLSAEMFIYNRWGTEIFTSEGLGTGWNGEIDGEPAEIGVYVFYANITFVNGDQELRKGNITLIR